MTSSANALHLIRRPMRSAALFWAVAFALITLLGSLRYTAAKGWTHHEEWQGDVYTDLAWNGMLQDGKPTAYRFPIYPLLLGIWLRLFGGEPGARLFQSILAALITLLAAGFAGRLAGMWGAAAAGVVMISSSLLLYSAAMLQSELLFTFLTILFTAVLYRWQARSSILFGVLLLTRGTLLLAMPLVLGIISPQRRMLFIGGALFVCLPWVVRNAIELHAFIPFSTGMGYVLLGANNPEVYAATGQGWPRGAWINDYTGEVQALGLDEVAQDREATRWALAFVRTQPPDLVVRVGLERLLNFVGRDDPAQTLWPVVLTLAAISIGVRRWRQWNRRALLICGALIGGTALNAVMFWGGGRFRFPIEPLIAVIAGLSIGGRWYANR